MISLSLTASLLAAAFLVVAAHPFVTYPLSLQLFFRKLQVPLADWSKEARPSVAICLSAYNEAAVIVTKVESLIRIAEAYGPATIHVYTDGCSDETAELLEPFRDRIDLIVSRQRTGKTHGMNVLIGRSDSELVMFTDANVEIPDDGLIRLSLPFVDPACGCATARLQYVNSKESPTSFAGSVYWRIEEWVKSLESATIGMLGVDGASFVVRRKSYRPAPPDLIDDLFVTLAIHIEGGRVVRAPDVTVHEYGAVRVREEYRRKVRIACQAMNVHKVMWPSIRKQNWRVIYGYVSHRLIKWMIPFLLACAALSLLAAIWLQFGLGVGAGILGCGLAALGLGALGVPGLSLLTTIVVSLTGVGQGVATSLFGGQSFTTWEPAESVRRL